MHEILILSFSAIDSDPRVMRQVRLLESDYRVTVAGFGSKPAAQVEFIAIPRSPRGLARKIWWGAKLLTGFFESYYWSRPEVVAAVACLAGRHFDLIIANDIAALPLALQVARGYPVLMDAHEYSPREFDDKWLWRMLFSRYHDQLCSRYLPRASSMVTVCQGIADEYARNYGVAPVVVHNAPWDQKLSPSDIDPACIRLVHHGAAIRSRHLETMIEVMDHLDDRFTLDFMLVETDPAYMKELRDRAADNSRIRFVPPVAMADICRALNDYDIGIYLLPPVNFNHVHALPNKLFEFIQARLAVMIGPSPEMACIVNDFGLGMVAPSFEPIDLAKMLAALTPQDIARFKAAADEGARQLSYENNAAVMLGEISRLLSATDAV